MSRIMKAITTLKTGCSSHSPAGWFGFVSSLCVRKQRILVGSILLLKALPYSLLEFSSGRCSCCKYRACLLLFWGNYTQSPKFKLSLRMLFSQHLQGLTHGFPRPFDQMSMESQTLALAATKFLAKIKLLCQGSLRPRQGIPEAFKGVIGSLITIII